MKELFSKILFLLLIFLLGFSAFAQTKKRSTTKKTTKPAAKTTPTPTKQEEKPVETQTVKTEVKKNERPAETKSTDEPQKTNSKTNSDSTTSNKKSFVPVYFYEFSQPNFYVAKVLLEHDENGKGEITFVKNDADEEITDPVQLSPATLEKIKAAFEALNFLDSKENYQDAERNYGHLGNILLKIKKDGREREAAFNWTQNKEAKILMDEYRKVANQYVWIFQINLSRQNQPLEAPNLMTQLDSYLRRSEISDPPQMIPFLKKLADDERIPLIARNHATRLIKEIEKKAEKESKK